MAHYRTQYEIIARREDGSKRFRVGFSARKSRQGIAACIQRRRDFFMSESGLGAHASFHNAGKNAFAVGEWIIEFSGRTLRDVEFAESRAA